VLIVISIRLFVPILSRFKNVFFVYWDDYVDIARLAVIHSITGIAPVKLERGSLYHQNPDALHVRYTEYNQSQNLTNSHG